MIRIRIWREWESEKSITTTWYCEIKIEGNKPGVAKCNCGGVAKTQNQIKQRIHGPTPPFILYEANKKLLSLKKHIVHSTTYPFNFPKRTWKSANTTTITTRANIISAPPTRWTPREKNIKGTPWKKSIKPALYTRTNKRKKKKKKQKKLAGKTPRNCNVSISYDNNCGIHRISGICPFTTIIITIRIEESEKEREEKPAKSRKGSFAN